MLNCARGWTYGVAVVDIEDEGIAAQSGTPLPFPAPDDIAYVILHLGTTGTPKGGGWALQCDGVDAVAAGRVGARSGGRSVI